MITIKLTEEELDLIKYLLICCGTKENLEKRRELFVKLSEQKKEK